MIKDKYEDFTQCIDQLNAEKESYMQRIQELEEFLNAKNLRIEDLKSKLRTAQNDIRVRTEEVEALERLKICT